ncbi:MAG: ABC transporter ATP-binding protein [Pseudomonadales bacterium]
MSSDGQIAVSARHLSKCYRVFASPSQRLVSALRNRVPLLSGNGGSERLFWALRDVSFDISRGECVGIVGRNGAGKSTLLQLLAGTLEPTSGTCIVNGSVAALLELGSGFNPEFSGIENVRLYARVLGIPPRQLDEMIGSILEFADIGDFVEQPVKTYSSGMVVRLAFAVSVARNPEVLIVDEALAVGDEGFKRKCFARLEEMRAHGTTLLFVSHSASLVAELCDRVIVIDGGELIFSGDSQTGLSWYTKLLFASPGERASVRRDFACLQSNTSKAVRQAPGAPATATPAGEERSEDEQAFFSPGIVSQSRVEYAPAGASIFDEEIVSGDGKRVNVLVTGDTYQYRYKVRFDRAAEHVGFGMMVKSVTGSEVGGCVYPGWQRYVPAVRAGEVCSVRFAFRCLMNPGFYFLNAGVQGTSPGLEHTGYLHRILDAVMFKVQPTGDQVATGVVNLDVAGSVESLDGATEWTI